MGSLDKAEDISDYLVARGVVEELVAVVVIELYADIGDVLSEVFINLAHTLAVVSDRVVRARHKEYRQTLTRTAVNLFAVDNGVELDEVVQSADREMEVAELVRVKRFPDL